MKNYIQTEINAIMDTGLSTAVRANIASGKVAESIRRYEDGEDAFQTMITGIMDQHEISLDTTYMIVSMYQQGYNYGYHDCELEHCIEVKDTDSNFLQIRKCVLQQDMKDAIVNLGRYRDGENSKITRLRNALYDEYESDKLYEDEESCDNCSALIKEAENLIYEVNLYNAMKDSLKNEEGENEH